MAAPVIQSAASDASSTDRPLISSACEPPGQDATQERIAQPRIGCHARPQPVGPQYLRRQDAVHPHAASGPFGGELARHLITAAIAIRDTDCARPSDDTPAIEPMPMMLPLPCASIRLPASWQA